MTAPTARWPHWTWVAVAVLAAGVVGVSAGRAWQPTPVLQATSPSAAPALATHFRRLTTDGAEWPALSPDGTWFVFSRKVNGKYHLFRQRISGENALDLTPTSTEDEIAPAISPNGEQIAWQSTLNDGGVFVMGATGESARRLTNFGNEPSWKSDGKSLLVSNTFIDNPSVRDGVPTSLSTVDLATGAAQPLLGGLIDRTQAVWSPDGRSVAYHSSAHPGWRSVAIEAIDGGSRQRLTPDGIAWTPRWSSDGAQLYFSSNQSGAMNLWRVATAADGALGQPVPLTAGVGLSSHHPTLSRDGHLILFAASRRISNIFRVPYDARAMKVTGPAVPVTHGAHSYWGPHVSPDGQWVAFAEGLTGGQEDIFVARADGTDRRRLTDDAAWDRLPRFTWDSQRLIFYSTRAGADRGHTLWSVAVDGSGLRRLTEPGVVDRPHVGQATFALPSPTDSRLVARFWLPAGGNTGVVFDASKPFELEEAVQMGPRGGERNPRSSSWSHDGSEILSPTTHDGVFAWSPSTGKYRHLTAHQLTPFDLRDGRLLGRLADGRLAVVELATQHLEVLPVATGPEDHNTISVSRDGAWIYFAQAENESDAWLAELP